MPADTLPLPPHAPSSEDAALLSAVGQGDRQAFQALYARWGGRLLAYVNAMGARGPQGEDLVQEIFLTLWQKASLYRPELGSPEAWIFTLTRHKVLDIWRRPRPVVEVEPDFLEALVGDDAGHANVEQGLSLRKAMGTLMPDQRRALQLAYFGELSYAETAQAMGIPVGTLKSRIRSALSRLRESLGASS